MKQKVLQFSLLCILFSSSMFGQSTQELATEIINQVNGDSLYYLIRQLSGDTSITVNGEVKTIKSRNFSEPGNDIAADFIAQKLESYGLEAITQPFDSWVENSNGENVYAIQVGTEKPDDFIIICGHFDSMPIYEYAPGADDNASGTAGVIEAARIFTQYEFPFSIVYALWDEEEMGLLGAYHFAELAHENNMKIHAVLNMDMIAYDSDNDLEVDLHTRNYANSVSLAQRVMDFNEQYNIGLTIDYNNPGSTASDHAAFWSYGYSAILLIEDFSDFHPHYHTPEDVMEYINTPYMIKNVRLMLAALTHYALGVGDIIASHHPPFDYTQSTEPITMEFHVSMGIEPGDTASIPYMYYRVFNNNLFTDFTPIQGAVSDNQSTFNFTIPGQSLGSVVEYYFAIKNSDNTILKTYPSGGDGFFPPGHIPPEERYSYAVAPFNTVFSDAAETLDNWNVEGDWNITQSTFISEPSAFTDSPDGNYKDNQTSSMVFPVKIALENIHKATLEFDAKWDIEEGKDYAAVRINYSSLPIWKYLEGNYTTIGEDPQPSQPIYDGTQEEWVHEQIDLSFATNKDVALRFELVSDESNNADGFYVDNIIIKGYYLTDIESDEGTELSVKDYTLSQNYPNPFNPSTTIMYSLPESGQVSLKVYDVLGSEIITLVNDYQSQGSYSVQFFANNLPSGMYFYTLRSGNFMETKKMLLVK